MPFLHALVVALALVCLCSAPLQAPLASGPVDAAPLAVHGLGQPDLPHDEGFLHADASEDESDRPVLADEKPTGTPMQGVAHVPLVAVSNANRSTMGGPGPSPDVMRERKPPRHIS